MWVGCRWGDTEWWLEGAEAGEGTDSRCSMLRDSSRPLLDRRRSRLPYLRSGPEVMQGHVHISLATSASNYENSSWLQHIMPLNSSLLRQCQQTTHCDNVLHSRKSSDANMTWRKTCISKLTFKLDTNKKLEKKIKIFTFLNNK